MLGRFGGSRGGLSMSGIGVGALLALFGFFLFGTQEPAGLIFVIVGFVSLFSGMASQQDQKRLREAQKMKALAMPREEAGGYGFRAVEDENRAAAACLSSFSHAIRGVWLFSGARHYDRKPPDPEAGRGIHGLGGGSCFH